MSNWKYGNYRYTRRHIDHVLDNYAQFANPWGVGYGSEIGTLYPAVIVPHYRDLAVPVSRPIRKSNMEPDKWVNPLCKKCDVDMAVNSLGKTPWQAVLLNKVHYAKGFPKLSIPQRALLGPFVGVTDVELETWVQDVYKARATAYGEMLWFLNGRGLTYD